jgi:hypothetical protein
MFSSIRPKGGLTKLIGDFADADCSRSVRANVALAVFMGILSLVSGPASAWSNHGLATYWAFATMPEIANAKPVTVEPIEAFLREQEPAIEALLAAQEDWARANLSNYPPRPAALAFTADAARDDHARRQAFLEALRVAPDIKLALFVQPDPSTRLDPARRLPYAAVSTLPEPPLTFFRFSRLDAGDTVAALSVLATAANEPDFGTDINCWEDSPSEWGKRYRFGTLPFGDPSANISTQAPFHMGFYQQARALYWAAPFVGRTYPLLRVHQFFGLAELAFRTGHPYWGWRFTGNAAHYVQDLTQPYHASLLPGISTLRMLGINLLAMLGRPGLKNDMIVLVSNRHFALERYQVQLLHRTTDRDEQAPILMALRPGDGDATYPAWSEHYARDVVSAEAFAYGDRLDALLAAAMPAHYVSDTRYHFFSEGGNVDLLDEVTKREAVQRADLESAIAELFRHFGAHSRNLVRGLLRASRSLPP